MKVQMGLCYKCGGSLGKGFLQFFFFFCTQRSSPSARTRFLLVACPLILLQISPHVPNIVDELCRRPYLSYKQETPASRPHGKNSSIWAFIRLLGYMAWIPTKVIFHIVAATVFARVRHVWGDGGDFIDYFCGQYMVRTKEPEDSPSRCEWLWSARWWAGISSKAAMGQPPSQ